MPFVAPDPGVPPGIAVSGRDGRAVPSWDLQFCTATVCTSTGRLKMPAPAHFDTVFFWHRAVFFWHRAVSFWHRSFWHRLVLIFLVVSAIAGCTGGGPTAEPQLEAGFEG